MWNELEEGGADWCYVGGTQISRRRIRRNVLQAVQESPPQKARSNTRQESITKRFMGFAILATLAFLSLMQFQHPPIRKLAVLQNEVPLTTTTNQPIESLAKRRRTPSHPTPRADLLGQIRTESLLAAHKESATTMIRQRKDVGLEAAAAAARRKQHKLEASLLQIESTKRIPEASNP